MYLKDKRVGFKYSVPSWSELPIDSSINELAQELGCSRRLLRNALEDLDAQCAAGQGVNAENFWFREIVEGRKEKNGGSKDGLRDDRDTRPAALYWEIKDLVAAIARARMDGRGIKGNELAKRALINLAKDLSNDREPLAHHIFCRTKLLSNERIQQEMLQLFAPEIKKRQAVIDYLLTQPLYQHSRIVLEMCEAIDALILEVDSQDLQDIINSRDIDLPRDDEAQMRRLYQAMLRPRMLNQRRVSDGTKTFLFHLPEDNEGINGEIIKELEEILPKGELPPGERKSTRWDALEKTYDRYLLASEDPEISAKADEFESYFKDAQNYIYGGTSDEEFEKSVRAELAEYGQSIFEDLESLRIFPFSYSNYSSHKVSDRYIGKLLRNCHDHILYAVLPGLSFLQIYYSFASLGGICEDANQERLEALRRHMRDEIFKLLPLVIDCSNRLSDKEYEEFVTKYNSVVVPVLHTSPICQELLKDLWQTACTAANSAEPIGRRVLRTANMLLLSCHMAVCCEIETSVQHLLEDRRMLAKVYDTVIADDQAINRGRGKAAK